MNDFDQKMPENDLPDGYFDQLADAVFSKMEAENDLDLPDFLKNDRLKKSPFSLPKNYFDSLGAQVFSKIEAENSDDELPDFLKNEALKKSPFSLPKNYFEGLEARVFEKKEARKIAFLPLFQKIGGSKTAFAMAAALALLIAALAFFQKENPASPAVLAQKNDGCETAKCLADSLTEADALAFLNENLDEFEAEDLAEAAEIAAAEPLRKTKKQPLDGLDLDAADAEILLDELDAEDLEDLL